MHTAPAHGEDDFRVCMEHGIEFTCHGTIFFSAVHCLFVGTLADSLPTLVDDQGKFMESVDKFAGMDVLGNGNDAVIEALKGVSAVLKEEKYQHKYPYDWRSKKPVIVR